MKIAVIIVGDWRTGFDTYPYNSYFLEKPEFEIDYFIYTYTRNNIRIYDNKDSFMIYETLTESDKQNIIKLYNPKKIVFQEASHSYCPPGNPTWYLFKKGVELVNEYEKETGTKYDYYLKIRPDIILIDYTGLIDNKSSIKQQINELSKLPNNFIINFFPFDRDWKNRLNEETLHDLYILGKPDTIKTYSEILEWQKKNTSKVCTQYRWLFENNIEYFHFNILVRVLRYHTELKNLYPESIESIIKNKKMLLKCKNPIDYKTLVYADNRLPIHIKKSTGTKLT